MRQADRPSSAETQAQIDRTSFEPPYHQLAGILRQQIASGALRAYDRLPSEAQLCKRYQVSPMTVRRAINILLEQGLVSTAQGRGTFVKPLLLSTATFDLKELEDLFRDEHTTVGILEAHTVPADERIARKLPVAAGAKVIYMRRLLSLAGEPVIYHREYVIYDAGRPVVEAELEVTTLRGLFDGNGQTGLKRGELSIQATVLNEEEAPLLRATLGLPAFRIEHIFYDFDDRPTSWGWFICRGDRLRFRAAVGAPHSYE